MIFPYFASFIVFIIWLTYELKKSNRISTKKMNAYWEREHAANNVRRKSLDSLDYIQVPFERLPFTIMKEDEKVAECQHIIQTFKNKKTVNFTGISNTDLKYKFGAPNITILTEYDQNYTLLVRTLQTWGELLYKNNYVKDAQIILEFALSTKTDIRATYVLLKEIYTANFYEEGILHLKEIAMELNSAMKPSILALLDDTTLL